MQHISFILSMLEDCVMFLLSSSVAGISIGYWLLATFVVTITINGLVATVSLKWSSTVSGSSGGDSPDSD